MNVLDTLDETDYRLAISIGTWHADGTLSHAEAVDRLVVFGRWISADKAVDMLRLRKFRDSRQRWCEVCDR